MINEVRRFEQVLDLERAFTVVYWDQRGCGLSLRGPKVPGGITVEQMIRDTVALLDLLRERFAKVLCRRVLARRGGRTHAAAIRPDLVEALVAVAMDIDGVAAGTNAYDFAPAQPDSAATSARIRQLTGIGAPPHLTSKQFTTRVRWAANFGGVTSNRTYAALVRELLVSVARAMTTRSPTSFAPSAASAWRRPLSSQNSPCWTSRETCPASVYRSSWCKVAETRWRLARPRNDMPWHWTPRASNSSGSTTRHTHRISRNRTSSDTS